MTAIVAFSILYAFPCAPSERTPISFSSTFISPLFYESIPVQVMVDCSHATVISALSSPALTSVEDMTRESRINYTNRMVLTACHPLPLPTIHNLGIGSPDLRPSTGGVQYQMILFS
jgi:hypothetical protein